MELYTLTILNNKWDLTQLPTLYISHKYDINYKYNIHEDSYTISMDSNFNTMYNDPNFVFIKKNGLNITNQIIQSYYDICESKFSVSHYEKSLFYASFFTQHNIKNTFISFIIIYSIHILHSQTISNIHVDLFKKHLNLASIFVNFYNIQSLNAYIDFIKNIDI